MLHVLSIDFLHTDEGGRFPFGLFVLLYTYLDTLMRRHHGFRSQARYDREHCRVVARDVMIVAIMIGTRHVPYWIAWDALPKGLSANILSPGR